MKKYANTDAMNILPHVSGTNDVGARAQSGSRVKNKDQGLGASMGATAKVHRVAGVLNEMEAE